MNFDWKKEYYRYHRYFFDIRKKTETPKTRSFTWLSLSIFTVSFFVLVAIRPTVVTIAKLNREIVDKEKASNGLQQKINSILQAQQVFTENSDRLYLLEDALPAKNEFPRLAYFFEQEAAITGVNLKFLNFEKIGKTAVSAQTSSFNFSLVVTGDYLKLKQFLGDLEISRRLIKIERASFNQLKKAEEIELSLSISGQAFFEGKKENDKKKL